MKRQSYDKTDEVIQPNQQFKMSGNTICVRILDLDCDFNQVSSQLNGIADAFIKGEL